MTEIPDAVVKECIRAGWAAVHNFDEEDNDAKFVRAVIRAFVAASPTEERVRALERDRDDWRKAAEARTRFSAAAQSRITERYEVPAGFAIVPRDAVDAVEQAARERYVALLGPELAASQCVRLIGDEHCNCKVGCGDPRVLAIHEGRAMVAAAEGKG